jgi:hypothetical protein
MYSYAVELKTAVKIMLIFSNAIISFHSVLPGTVNSFATEQVLTSLYKISSNNNDIPIKFRYYS